MDLSGGSSLLERMRDLKLSFLNEADSRKLNDVVRQCVADIRELAYDAEDVIETFALKVASKKKRGFIKRSACFMKEGWVRHETKSEIERITARIIELTRRLQTYGIRRLRDGGSSSSSTERREAMRPYPHIIDQVVGLDDFFKNMVSIVVDVTNGSKVVSICGMGGLGKTTLAMKIYRHCQVIRHFDSLAWVNVSLFQKREIWEDILTGLTSNNERGSKRSDEDLAAKLFSHLEKNKCLVILDDIWSIDAWDLLKPGFPTTRESRSKFLLTSRNKQIFSHADPSRGLLYELQCLSDEKSWELFRIIAFPEKDSTENIVDVEMEKLGKEMVHRCAGLPLAIIVLGGILDYEIDAERLIQLWVAEGFVSSDEVEGKMMEDVAEGWLVELVERCMVQVGKRHPIGKIKTCRMHDLMRDLCLSMARKDNFACITGDPSFPPARRIAAHQSIAYRCIKSPRLRSMLFFCNPTDKEGICLHHWRSLLPPARRIAAHQSIASRCIKSPRLRSMLFFCNPTDKVDYDCNSLLRVYLCCKDEGSWTSLLNNSKLLRVLEFQVSYSGRNAFELHDAIGNLIHLRFLNLRGFCRYHARTPPSLGNLKLRHLYLPDERQINNTTKLRLDTLRNLQTLVSFMKWNCFATDLSNLTNLRKLAMCGGFDIEDFKECSDKNLPIITSKHLQFLSMTGEKIHLKLVAHLLSSCVNLCELVLIGWMDKLPEYHHFPSNITVIRLETSRLKEDPMPTLEKLRNLRILELKHFAFLGKKMVCSAQYFPKLESLKLSWLFALEEWKVKTPVVPWHKLLWFPLHVPKHAIIVWIAILDRLSTRDRLLRMNSVVDPSCLN
ncbi:hypothetical protein F3Y22_tig00110220pilonHSYRG00130 [Hibiscus syriacus]|uniref:AAA+ ATPase domain-containing protein n=1 Tax=Hibiscus syriacus TaxID=106335 RepID=A0A6A3B7T1_HIBSY|nr:hypothetical protein F3Y22_tig00110220pilonHSYRG00130 [Hibiscus syriacus]